MIDRPDESGIAELTRGDVADARELRANLAVFARQSGDPEIRSLVSDVLAGRRNVREVFRHPEFVRTGERRLANLQAGIDALPEQRRNEIFAAAFDDAVARTSRETLDALRDASDPTTPMRPHTRR